MSGHTKDKKRKHESPAEYENENDEHRTPKKALDLIHLKHSQGFHSPLSKGDKKHGVVITRIIQDDIVLGVAVEGGYKAREFLNRKLREPSLRLLAPFAIPHLTILPIYGKYWKRAESESTVGGGLDRKAPYMISCTTNEAGAGSVLLYTVTKAQEVLGDDVDFSQAVLNPIERYFEHSKEPPVDDAILQDGPHNQIKTAEEAEAKWNTWPQWQVTKVDFSLDSDAKVDAFVELSLLT